MILCFHFMVGDLGFAIVLLRSAAIKRTYPYHIHMLQEAAGKTSYTKLF